MTTTTGKVLVAERHNFDEQPRPVAGKLVPWKLLGRWIGTVSGGWDVLTDDAFILFGFRPAPGVNLPQGDLTVNFETGRASICDDQSVDIITALKDVPVASN